MYYSIDDFNVIRIEKSREIITFHGVEQIHPSPDLSHEYEHLMELDELMRRRGFGLEFRRRRAKKSAENGTFM